MERLTTWQRQVVRQARAASWVCDDISCWRDIHNAHDRCTLSPFIKDSLVVREGVTKLDLMRVSSSNDLLHTSLHSNVFAVLLDTYLIFRAEMQSNRKMPT